MSTATTTNLPVYQQLINMLTPEIESLNLQVRDHKGWVSLVGSNGHRICLSKAMSKLPRCQTTLQVALEDSELVEGNGAIAMECRGTPANVSALMSLLNDKDQLMKVAKKGGSRAKAVDINSLI